MLAGDVEIQVTTPTAGLTTACISYSLMLPVLWFFLLFCISRYGAGLMLAHLRELFF